MPSLFLDIETDGLDVFDNNVVTIQMLLPSGKVVILKDPKNLDNIKPILEKSVVVGHNIKFDAKFLKHKFGVTLYNVYDTMIAELALSGGLYVGQKDVVGLKDLVARYCGTVMDKTEQVGFIYGVPLTQAQKEYAAKDLLYLPEIYKQQQAKIKSIGLEDVINTEMRALPAIVWLELSGIYVDQSKLNTLRVEVEAKKQQAKTESYKIFGTINLNSTQQLKKAFNKIGIPVESTNADELAKYDHFAVRTLKDYRDAEKLLNTFIDKIPAYINPKTGRVHANFYQIGAKSGRMSCNQPNLQQQPSKTLPEFRAIYRAEQGNKIVTADYSQVELRILGQESQDQEFLKAYQNNEDLHKLTASKIFKVPLELVNKKQRDIAKTVNFGIAYGMWTHGLQKRLRVTGIEITEKEAEEIITGFYKAYPSVTKYLRNISESGLKHREVRNLSGRLMKFKEPESQKDISSIKRESKNLPIQSLCADMLKIAMGNIFLKLEPMGVKFINTVHDELVFECKESQAEEVKAIVKEEREKAGSLFLTDLPCIAEVTISDVWEK
jgi:DNA polymerase-1